MSSPTPHDTTASPQRLVVLFGGRSAEHDVSCVSAAEVVAAASSTRYEIIPIGITHDGTWVRNDAVVAALSTRAALPDDSSSEAAANLPAALEVTGTEVTPSEALRGDIVVLPLLHGPHGEDGTVQGLLELADVPYVGSGVLGSAACMDKAMAKVIAAQAGIKQCRWLEYRDGRGSVDDFVSQVIDELGTPVFVKPANLGSSVGISKATDEQSLRDSIAYALRYDDVLVVEESVLGREIEVAVLGNTSPEASLPGEVLPGSDFYDYADKYVNGAARLSIPAQLSDDAIAEVRSLAEKVFLALRCAGLARVDFFYEEGGRGWLLNEINTIPGFTQSSMYPKMWEASGLAYSDVIDRLVALALERHARRSAFSTDH